MKLWLTLASTLLLSGCSTMGYYWQSVSGHLQMLNAARPVAEVLKAEPQYYDWMMKGDFPLHTKKKLTEILNRTLLKKQ